MYSDQDFENVVEHEEVSTKVLDDLLVEIKADQEEYDKINKKKSEAYAKLEEKKFNLISLMEKSGKTRWEVEGIGGFSLIQDLRFKVPADLGEKGKFLSFLKSDKCCELLGSNAADVYLSYVSVNSATMNKLCKILKERASKEGEDLQIPGIAAPKAQAKLRSLSKK